MANETLTATVYGTRFGSALSRAAETLTVIDGPTYELSADKTSISEDNETVTIIVTTTKVADGTIVHWGLTGITAANLNPPALSGTLVINSGSATYSFAVLPGTATEGIEALTFSINMGLMNRSIIISILDT